jgi:hypothetical protein
VYLISQFIVEYRLVYDKPLDDNDDDDDNEANTNDICTSNGDGEHDQSNLTIAVIGAAPAATDATLKNTATSVSERRDVLCYLTANGVFPKLKVIDIKGLGSSSSLSKDYMWKLLSVNE